LSGGKCPILSGILDIFAGFSVLCKRVGEVKVCFYLHKQFENVLAIDRIRMILASFELFLSKAADQSG
jgi:hypothetical protein